MTFISARSSTERPGRYGPGCRCVPPSVPIRTALNQLTHGCTSLRCRPAFAAPSISRSRAFGCVSPVRTIPKLARIGGLVRRAAKCIVRLSVIGHDAHKYPAHVREQQPACLQVAVPLNFDRIGHVQTLDGVFGVEHQHRYAGVAFEIDQAQTRSGCQLSCGISAASNRFLPQHRLACDAHGQIAGNSGRDRRHRLDPGVGHGTRMRAGRVADRMY